MQQRIEAKREKTRLRGALHPRNLDPPLPACYLPAEAFLFWHLTGGRPRVVFSGGNMKKTGLFVLLLATAGWAQGVPDLSTVEAPAGTAPTSASFPVERIPT